MRAEPAQALACGFKFATLKCQWLTPVSGLGPELCHNRGHALPHPGLAECGRSGLCWCDSGTGSHLCNRFGTGTWQVYESANVAITPINRHQSSIDSLKSYRTSIQSSKYRQLTTSLSRPRTEPESAVTEVRTRSST